MIDPMTMTLVLMGLCLAGVVKGALGVGFPVVAMSLLTVLIEPKTAIALVALPVLVTNAWQAYKGGRYRETLSRYRVIILTLVTGTCAGAVMVAKANTEFLLGAIGAVAVLFAVINFLRPELRVSKKKERWVGPLTGMGAGIVGGLTTVHGPPIMMYLMALGLKKEEFVRTIGFIWFCGSVPMFSMYLYMGVIGAEELLWSLSALVPVFMGVTFGEFIRNKIDQDVFKKVLIFTLFAVGINLIRKSVL
ncbi:MAG: sulfite exporter TauE/SafE family protein [Motiliproteus sp.]